MSKKAIDLTLLSRFKDNFLKDIKDYISTIFGNKVDVDQGVENADKILTTNAEGKVVTELTAWTEINVIETLADTDMINIIKNPDESILVDENGKILSF